MKDVPFKKITVILKYRSASRDSKTDYRAMKAHRGKEAGILTKFLVTTL